MNYRKIIEKEYVELDKTLQGEIKNPLLCDLLAIREINTKERIDAFLNPKKQTLSGIDVFEDGQKAVDRIRKAIDKQERILIWGDFDADGVCSSSILHKAFAELGANFTTFIPSRKEHGHGLHSKVALQLVAKEKIKVLITVDCGISNSKEVSLLKSLGVDVIITDHHKQEDESPKAYAILNPQAQGSLKSDLSLEKIKDLCNLAGVGVAHILATALLDKCDNKNVLDEILILNCTGTISDVVPIVGENRTIVAKGLDLINSNKHLGIKKLFERCNKKEISSTDVAFLLTPRINATGRLSTPENAFEMLTSTNEAKIDMLIEKLDNYNKIRQSLCDEIFSQAKEEVLKDRSHKKAPAIIIHNSDWHLGIIGIVASRLVEEFLKPVFIMTSEDNIYKCSIRSIGGYNVYNILKNNQELFLGFGGHSLAGGFSFDSNVANFNTVKESILKTIEENFSDVKIENSLFIDKFIDSNALNMDIIKTIEQLEPFGQKNPAPLFGLKDSILKNKKTIGKENNHLKINIEKDGAEFEALKWNTSDLKIPQNGTLDVAFSVQVNTFQEKETLQLMIEDVFSQDYTNENEEVGLKIHDHREKEEIYKQIDDYVKRDNLDITVFARENQTITTLSAYSNITQKLYKNENKYKSIMLFDYPTSADELEELFNNVQPDTIHLMKAKIDNDINNYIKTLSGMLKYISNKKNGELEIEKISNFIGTSENFVQLALEIFEGISSIELLDVDKITFFLFDV